MPKNQRQPEETERANTRAYRKMMEEMQASTGAEQTEMTEDTEKFSITSLTEECRDDYSEEECEKNEIPREEDDIKRKLQSLINSKIDKSSLIAELQGLLEECGAATEGEEIEMGTEGEGMVSDPNPPSQPKGETNLKSAPELRQPFCPMMQDKMAKQQPMRSPNSKYLAGNEAYPDLNPSHDHYDATAPPRRSSTAPKQSGINEAIEILTAAYGKIKIVSCDSDESEEHYEGAYTQGGAPNDLSQGYDYDSWDQQQRRDDRTTILPPPRPNATSKEQKQYSPHREIHPKSQDHQRELFTNSMTGFDQQKERHSYSHPPGSAAPLHYTSYETDFRHEDNDHQKGSAHQRPPRAEHRSNFGDRSLRCRATEDSSFPDASRDRMAQEHAQYRIHRDRNEGIETSHHRLTTSIPLPYCEFPYAFDHGQQLRTSISPHSSGNLPADFPRLTPDGQNFQDWYQQLQVILLKEHLIFLITDPPLRPWTFDIDCMHHRGYFILLTSMSPSVYPCLEQHMTVSEIISLLHKMFHSRGVASTSRLSRNFYSYKLRPGVSLSEHIIKLKAIRAELTQRGDRVTDECMKSVIINSLDPSWESFVMYLDGSHMEHIPLEMLISKLIAEDNHRRDKETYKKDIKVTKRVEFQSRNTRDTECFNCGSKNHLRRDCPRNVNYTSKPYVNNNAERRYKQSDRHSPDRAHKRRDSPDPRERKGHTDRDQRNHRGSVYGLGSQINTIKNNNHLWLLDSGATNHITNDSNLLTSISKEDFTIKVANQNNVKVTGRGKAIIPEIGEIEGVLLVPEVPYNILATLKLSKDNGTDVLFRNGSIIVTKEGKTIGRTIVKEELPYFQPNIDKATKTGTRTSANHLNIHEENKQKQDSELETNKHTTESNRPYLGKPIHDECAHLLHRKLGHCSFPVVQKMISCAEGLKLKGCENYLECSVCKCSKLKVKARPKRSERTTKTVFQMVHMDIVGPLRPSIKYRKRFFLTIVDDYSRYGYVYTLKHKHEFFQKFKEFYSKIELQHNIKIQQIMTDRGSEFMSNDFTQWLRARGVMRFTSAPFSPFQNGIAEKKNGTLQTMVRCVLEDAGLGQHFWAEAVIYANYTLNRLWCSVINKTPYEMMYHRKPQLAHLHVFGVSADVHIPKQLRHKGDKVSRRLRFMGYESGTKGYRFIDNNNRFIVSRSAVFHENTNWTKIHLNEILPRGGRDHNNQPEHALNIEQRNKDTLSEIEVRETKGNQPKLKIDSLTKKQAKYLHDTDTPTTDRPIRANRNKTPKRLEDYVLSLHNDNITPSSYEEVLRLPRGEKEKWEQAMEKEMDSLRELKVYTPSKVPNDKSTIGTRWIYKIKSLEGNEKLYKARLVAQGFAQRFPDDYTDTYSPTVRAESVKCALVIASILNLDVHQFDVQTAYLHAELDKEIYVRAPHSLHTQKGETWLLNKSLYGLKQSGKRWYECLARTLESMGFTATTADNCFFIKKGEKGVEYVLVYVDDILYISGQNNKCEEFSKELGKHFSLKILGRVDKYLGVQINKTDKGFKLTQKEKIIELLQRCNMTDAKPSETPMQPDFIKHMRDEAEPFNDNTLYRSVIGSLLYIANWTRPDIALAVNLLSRHVGNPTTIHWDAIKKVLRYLKFSADACLNLEPELSDRPILRCYADADWAGDTKSRKSTSGYVFFLNNCPIYWYTGKQSLVATSTTEAEYICLSKATNDLIWFDDLLLSVWTEPTCPINIYEDNKAALEISKSDALGKRSRHIDIKFKHVRQLSKLKFIDVIHCETKEQTADVLTKPLINKQHTYLSSKLGVKFTTGTNRHLEGDLLDVNACDINNAETPSDVRVNNPGTSLPSPNRPLPCATPPEYLRGRPCGPDASSDMYLE